MTPPAVSQLAPTAPPAPAPAAPPAPAGPPTAGAAELLSARMPANLDAATRELIEKVVWEVVPELAETLIREELARLLKARGVGA